jgi:tRNA-splicing ligase RtcB
LLASNLRREELEPVEQLVHELSRSIPTGYGRHGRLSFTPQEIDRVLVEGRPYLIAEHELGRLDDLAFIESRGCLSGADACA